MACGYSCFLLQTAYKAATFECVNMFEGKGGLAMAATQKVMPTVFADRPRLEQVAPNVYRVDMAVPEVLGPTNSYIIKTDGIHDSGRSLIIDVGCSQPITRAIFNDALGQLGIPWHKVDVFITHFHWDHCAGLAQVWQRGMTVYGGLADFALRGTPIMAAERVGEIERATTARHGELDEYDAAYWRPMADWGWGTYPITVLSEGEELCVGGYRFRVLETPGHDMHHLCLYDEKARLFVGGDQVMESLYPSIVQESDDDQVTAFQHTVKRLAKLDANLVLTGHGTECHNLSERCEQILAHYDRQIAGFLELCDPSITDPAELAYLSTMRPRRKPWAERPVFGRRALIGQTTAYLRHLVCTGKLPDQYDLIPLS